MPGLRSDLARDATGLHFFPIQGTGLSSPPLSTTSPELDCMHMPLPKITVGYAVSEHDTASALTLYEDPNLRNCPNFNRFTVNHKDQSRVLSQVRSDLHGSAESECDLAAMVHDFIENGSNGSDFPKGSVSVQNGMITHGPKPFETLQALRLDAPPTEKELLHKLILLTLSFKEVDLICVKQGAECNGGCIRRLLVKHLRLSGYDAAICTSKWSNSGKLPGGEYEYIDVYVGTDQGSDRLIVDIDFLSQFEIARPTHSYATALKLLPVIFVGSAGRLEQTLQVMAEAAKLSLRQNLMPLPPWRTLDYMTAKWMSPCGRNPHDSHGTYRSLSTGQWRGRARTKPCAQQLRHLRNSIPAEAEKAHSPGQKI